MTARVKGPTDNVVVVGAGLAGLSAALRLAGAGRKVTVIERESVPGGRNGLLNKSGFSFDTGPSVLTMPDLISDALACVGEDIKDWLDLVPLKPLYRAFYDDGTQLDVHADTNQMQAEIARTIGSQEAIGYGKYVDFVTKLYKYEMNDFIDRNIDSPLNLLTPNLARLIALGGFRKLAPKVNQMDTNYAREMPCPSADHLTEILDDLYQDEEKRRQVGDACYQRVTDPQFSWDTVASQFGGIFEDVMNQVDHSVSDENAEQTKKQKKKRKSRRKELVGFPN